MQNNTKQTLKIYVKSSAKYKWSLFFIVFSILASSILEVINPLFYKKFFDILATATDISAVQPDLIKTLLTIAGINLISWSFWRVSIFTANFLESAVLSDLANFCFSILHKHSFSFFNNNFFGSLTKKVNRFTRSYESIIDRCLWEFLPLITSSIVIFIVLFNRSIYLGGALLIWMIIFLSLNFLFIKYKIKYDIARSEMDSKVTGLLADGITNHSTISLFCGLNNEKKSFFSLNEKLRKLRNFVWNINAYFQAFQSLLMLGLEFGIFFIAIKLKEQNIITLGDFVLIQTYLIQIFSKMWNFGHILQKIYEDLADADEMTDIILLKPEIEDSNNAKDLKISDGLIEFKNVDFSYHNNKVLLNNFNLTVKSNERLALVGHSGAGKTTVIKLLLRMHEVTNGEILIDSQNISQVTQTSLWENISLVPQDPSLFHRTLMENIRYGKPSATDEEVITAAKFAHCDEFITNLPQGYNTYVGERGVKLSGGERQRVAIARAILRNAPILVLDEATSSLDSLSERLIQDALDFLMKDKTVIVVAHRLSTIMKMDRIIVIQNGAILEQGTHNELLKSADGNYKKMWEMQAGGFIK